MGQSKSGTLSTGKETELGFLPFLDLLFHEVDRAATRIEFLEKASQIILDTLGCDALELRVHEVEKFYRCRAGRAPHRYRSSEAIPFPEGSGGKRYPLVSPRDGLERLIKAMIEGRGPAAMPVRLPGTGANGASARWTVVLPLKVDHRRLGYLIAQHPRKAFFGPAAMKWCESAAFILSIALVHQRVLAALRERVKEETCLFNISKLIARRDADLDAILQGLANLLPPAWRYPDIASCRITVDDKVFDSPNFRDGPARQSAPITVGGAARGLVEVVYAEERPARDEGPFLEEERNLIAMIALQAGLLVEEKQATQAHVLLEEQLRHADRLATIGQLAGGVAHELNEPLAGILGFAQLVLKNKELPESARSDLERIKSAALHSREVIRKLLIFGRRMPTTSGPVAVNRMVTEALSILSPQCAKEGIAVEMRLAQDLPSIQADPAQVVQVVVNLVVNALQAMPRRGTLTVETRAEPSAVELAVQDTGIGMNEETLSKIFLPFFTTKNEHQGTGLGLAVVHGIVNSHGGDIEVKSKLGEGTRFTIRFPLTEPDPEGEEAS